MSEPTESGDATAKVSTAARRKAVKRWWEKLSWPQVGALAVLVAGAIAVWVAVPADKLPPAEMLYGLVAMVLGGGTSAALGPLWRREPAPPTD